MIKLKLVLLLAITFLVYPYLLAQRDSIKTKYSIDLDLGAGIYYQFSQFGNTEFNNVKIPELLPRRINDPNTRNNWGLAGDRVTDNPFFHGSYFFNFGGKFNYANVLAISAAITAEQRGFSDGAFSGRTRNIYPYFNATLAKKHKKFSYLFQLGDFRNLKLYEGLTFYNLETQSWVFKLKYDNFYIKHVGIADLLRGIGLGIDDVYDYSLGFEEFEIGSEDELRLNLGLGYSNNRGSISNGFWNFAGSFIYKKHLKFYTQSSIRRNQANAILLGLAFEKEKENKFKWSTKFEYRFYAAEFNRGFTNTVYYRNPSESASFTNSTNNVFIPLDYYEREFSQWAVFTEYQQIDVQNLMLQNDLKVNLTSKLHLIGRLDFNWVLTREENFLYPFYRLGLEINPEKNISITLEATNKVLNLDKNFPTFYASDQAYFLIRLYKPLKFFADNDQRHRKDQ